MRYYPVVFGVQNQNRRLNLADPMRKKCSTKTCVHWYIASQILYSYGYISASALEYSASIRLDTRPENRIESQAIHASQRCRRRLACGWALEQWDAERTNSICTPDSMSSGYCKSRYRIRTYTVYLQTYSKIDFKLQLLYLRERTIDNCMMHLIKRSFQYYSRRSRKFILCYLQKNNMYLPNTIPVEQSI